MDVFIDGVRYVPAKDVIVNRKQLLRALSKLYLGDNAYSDKQLEQEAEYLFVRVTDYNTNDWPTLIEFVDTL